MKSEVNTRFVGSPPRESKGKARRESHVGKITVAFSKARDEVHYNGEESGKTGHITASFAEEIRSDNQPRT